MRIDQQITSKQSVNFHVTYKNRRVEAPSNGSASLGSFSLPEIDYAYIGAYTYVISPRWLTSSRAASPEITTPTDSESPPLRWPASSALGPASRFRRAMRCRASSISRLPAHGAVFRHLFSGRQ